MTSIPSLEEKTKKPRNEDHQSITCLEDLANEVFYEIFDYLEGGDLYQAFSNLNYCFDQLLRCPFLRWKINIRRSSGGETCLEKYEQVIRLHKHQIYSIIMGLYSKSEEILSLCLIDSSLQRLESFFVYGIQSDYLMSSLRNLASLPRLFSLTVEISKAMTNLNEIYQLIFALLVLKRNKLTFYENSQLITFPTATNEQLSSIEDLHINDSHTFDELARIVSYTPQLRRLNFFHAEDDDRNIEMISPIRLSNLTHLTIYRYHSTFDQLEMLIKNLQCTLKFLQLTIVSDDLTYLDANRWKECIRRDLSQLDQLKFRYDQYIGDGETSTVDLGGTNGFTSSFWIERQWVFEANIYSEEILYLVHPYRKQPFQDLPHQISKSSRMTLVDIPPDDDELHFLIDDISSVLRVAQIYHLVVLEENISTDTLIEILLKLMNLLSIKIRSVSLEKSQTPYLKEEIAIQLSKTSKITAVILEEMNHIHEIDFLIELCPQISSLQLNWMEYIMDIEAFVENIIMKISEGNQYLQYLSFCSPAVDDQAVAQLERMSDSNVPLFDYTVERIDEQIVLQWK